MKILTQLLFESQKINTKLAFLQVSHQLELSNSFLSGWGTGVSVCHSPHYSLMFPPALLYSLTTFSWPHGPLTL